MQQQTGGISCREHSNSSLITHFMGSAPVCPFQFICLANWEHFLPHESPVSTWGCLWGQARSCFSCRHQWGEEQAEPRHQPLVWSQKLLLRTPLEAKLLPSTVVITVLQQMPFKYNSLLMQGGMRESINQIIKAAWMAPVLCVEGQEGSKQWGGRGQLFLVIVKLNLLFKEGSK